jgi:hypothetical protein
MQLKNKTNSGCKYHIGMVYIKIKQLYLTKNNYNNNGYNV